jgi:2-amino-4-hydroxy-6-hydroxymethyldihydropteridine diphosphokinase
MTTVFLALGSNLGDRQLYLTQALTLLPPEIAVERFSPIYETPPWGFADQPPFLNMVCQAETGLAPLELLDRLKFLEEKIGRQKTLRYGPRTIDLDILIYDSVVYHHPRLDIPHPRLAERAFVLLPLADLAPEFEHPALHKSIRDLLAQVDRAGIAPVARDESDAPAEIYAWLKTQSEVRSLYQNLPPSHQREYLKHILSARKPATRQRRLQQMADQLKDEGVRL